MHGFADALMLLARKRPFLAARVRESNSTKSTVALDWRSDKAIAPTILPVPPRAQFSREVDLN